MAAVVENPADVFANRSSIGTNGGGKLAPEDGAVSQAVDLGIWLSGLTSFIAATHSFEFRGGSHISDASREVDLTYYALERSLVLCFGTDHKAAGLEQAQMAELTAIIKDLATLGRCLRRSIPVASGEWFAWRSVVSGALSRSAAVRAIIRSSDRAAEDLLPEPLLSFSKRSTGLTSEQAELALVLPRFGRILRSLDVVGRMLEADEPLKPALVVMTRVSQLAQELIGYLDTRLERFPDKNGEIFASLDGASYLASIELKKVYTHEMAGLIRVRPATSLHSGMETAYSVLNESFQQILASLARSVDPAIESGSLFPRFQENFERSLALRRELWNLVRLMRAAEANPDKRRVQSLNEALTDFLEGPINYLFYKDTETVERFVEEISVAKQERDLVPTLHRFGAYLETLFGQVSMRAVLERHPFDPADPA